MSLIIIIFQVSNTKVYDLMSKEHKRFSIKIKMYIRSVSSALKHIKMRLQVLIIRLLISKCAMPLVRCGVFAALDIT